MMGRGNMLEGSGNAKWYAMPVIEGMEDEACAYIASLAKKSLVTKSEAGAPNEYRMKECFVPRCKVIENEGSDRKFSDHVLFSACLIEIQGDVNALMNDLKRTSALRKLVGRNASFIPLDDDTAAWVEAFTRSGSCSFGVSEGYMRAGRLTVTSGPLMGRESWVRKVNHRRKRAYLRMNVFGRTIDAEMGLRMTSPPAVVASPAAVPVPVALAAHAAPLLPDVSAMLSMPALAPPAS